MSEIEKGQGFLVDRGYQNQFLNGVVLPLGCDYDGMRNDYDGLNGSPGVESEDFICTPFREDCEEPNFEWKSRGLKIWWYKYPLRGAFSNIEVTPQLLAELILAVKGATE